MRERCSCGASIRTLSRQQVATWRTDHRHEAPEQEQLEHRDNDGTLIVHHDQPRYIGFTPQEERDNDV